MATDIWVWGAACLSAAGGAVSSWYAWRWRRDAIRWRASEGQLHIQLTVGIAAASQAATRWEQGALRIRGMAQAMAERAGQVQVKALAIREKAGQNAATTEALQHVASELAAAATQVSAFS